MGAMDQFRAAGNDTAARKRDQKKWDACPLWRKRRAIVPRGTKKGGK